MPFTIETVDISPLEPTGCIPDFKIHSGLTVGDIRAIIAAIPATHDSRPFVVAAPIPGDEFKARPLFLTDISECIDGHIMLEFIPSVAEEPFYIM